MKKKLMALLLVSVMALSVVACGGKSDGGSASSSETESSGETEAAPVASAEDVVAEEVAGDDFYGKSTDFSFMVANGITLPECAEYGNVPCLQYALTKEWDPDGNGNTRKINATVLTPPGGSEGDYANTLVSTGEYPDVMNIQIMSMTAYEMYEDGMTLDITDYVKQYMPNYMAFFDRHPEYAGRELTMVDGEPRYLGIYHLDEQAPQAWGGMMYRRDWIVKYGTNPETGEGFSGEWDADGNWVDDVVFPSGETWPKYVSDWEWMLDIFQTALDAQGITDGYAYSCKADGTNGAGGDMESGFGAADTFYFDPETGKCVNTFDTPNYRAYIEMLHSWYEKGWTNPHFYENAGQMFFMIDTASVYSGKVGAWYGTTGSLGSTMDSSQGDESNPTNGIVVFAAPNPINDVYGDESCQNITPFLYYATGQFGAQTVITDKAEDKDLPALFTFLDYFYSEEGRTLLTLGMNAEQVAECKDVAPEAYALYEKWGLANGAYTTEENGMYLKDPIVVNDQEIGGAAALVRWYGNTDETNLDQGWLPWKAEQMALYRMYPCTVGVGGEISSQMTPEESSEWSSAFSDKTTYVDINLPKFITGELDINDDAAWQKYCDDIWATGIQCYADAINRIIGYSE